MDCTGVQFESDMLLCLNQIGLLLCCFGLFSPALSLPYPLPNLISDHFASCDIIFAEDIGNEAYGGTDIGNLLTPVYSLLLENFKGSFFLSLRKYSQCFLVVSFMQMGTKYLGYLADLLFLPFAASVKSDKDYFIFISKSEDIASILTSGTSQLIKYKLVISDSFRDRNGFTYCAYCAVKVARIDLGNHFLPLHEIFPDFTRNGYGYAMRTSSPTKYGFTTEIQRVSQGEWKLVRGISKFLMDGVLTHYNFTYIVFSSPTGDTGGPSKNGTWDGCIGQLISGEADLSLTTSPNRARFKVIAFSSAAFYAWVTFTVGQPKIAYSWKAIFWPFKKELWLCVIMSLTMVIAVFKVFDKHEQRQFIHFRQQKTHRFYKNLIPGITFTLIGGNVSDPEPNPARVLLCIWILSAMVINSVYNSKLVGLLAQPVYNIVPRTFEDLADSTLSVGMDHSGGTLYAYFQSSTSPIFQKIFTKFEAPKETVECFDVATKSNFACITWAGVADYIGWRNFTIVNGRSPLLLAMDVANFIPCGLAMPRNAAYKPNFDKTISMIYDTGHGSKWTLDDLQQLQRNLLRWKRDQLNETVSGYSDAGPILLRLSNILGIFYIFALGLTTANLGFFIEKFVHRRVHKNPQN